MLLCAVGPAIACSEDTAADSVELAPARLLISAETTNGCIDVSRDSRVVALLKVDVSDFSLQSPGTCGRSTRCGTVVVRVDGGDQSLVDRRAQTTIDLDLSGFDDGPLTISAVLWGDNGVLFENSDGSDVCDSGSCELQVELCPAPNRDAGADSGSTDGGSTDGGSTDGGSTDSGSTVKDSGGAHSDSGSVSADAQAPATNDTDAAMALDAQVQKVDARLK